MTSPFDLLASADFLVPDRDAAVVPEATGSASDTAAVVRYISRDGDFTADLELDREGLLSFYPRLARRVEPGERVDVQLSNDGQERTVDVPLGTRP